MSRAAGYVLGIDVGTSGVKVLAIAGDGSMAGDGAAPLPAPLADRDRREQDADLWWSAVRSAVAMAVERLRARGGDPAGIEALAVDATSGTIVAVDEALSPLRPALMYDDARGGEQAIRLNEAGGPVLARLGYRFNASFALPKILWMHEHEPRVVERTACFLHQADLVVARLAKLRSPRACVTDESNALKTGFDLAGGAWPDYLDRVGVDRDRLPRVVATGQTIAHVDRSVAAALGLPARCRIVAGMTDGTAAAVASGAREAGDACTTLGTTTVWKIVAAHPVSDPAGRLYSHRHPGGAFLAGGAGNAGGAGIRALVAHGAPDAEGELARLSATLSPGPPSGTLSYPSPAPGERYPFVDPAFQPFHLATPDRALLYRSCLEGLACIERWGYEVAASLGARCHGPVWTAGRGAQHEEWMRLRAGFLDRPVCRAACPESAFGAAMVAAMEAWFDGSWPETTRLVRKAFEAEPDAAHRDACQGQYAAFRAACAAATHATAP